jgi:hypothetical protein
MEIWSNSTSRQGNLPLAKNELLPEQSGSSNRTGTFSPSEPASTRHNSTPSTPILAIGSDQSRRLSTPNPNLRQRRTHDQDSMDRSATVRRVSIPESSKSSLTKTSPLQHGNYVTPLEIRIDEASENSPLEEGERRNPFGGRVVVDEYFGQSEEEANLEEPIETHQSKKLDQALTKHDMPREEQYQQTDAGRESNCLPGPVSEVSPSTSPTAQFERYSGFPPSSSITQEPIDSSNASKADSESLSHRAERCSTASDLSSAMQEAKASRRESLEEVHGERYPVAYYYPSMPQDPVQTPYLNREEPKKRYDEPKFPVEDKKINRKPGDGDKEVAGYQEKETLHSPIPPTPVEETHSPLVPDMDMLSLGRSTTDDSSTKKKLRLVPNFFNRSTKTSKKLPPSLKFKVPNSLEYAFSICGTRAILWDKKGLSRIIVITVANLPLTQRSVHDLLQPDTMMTGKDAETEGRIRFLAANSTQIAAVIYFADVSLRLMPLAIMSLKMFRLPNTSIFSSMKKNNTVSYLERISKTCMFWPFLPTGYL